MNERVAAWSGVAAFAIFWVALFAFGAARQDYSHFHKAVSELGVLGAPHSLAWNLIGFIAPGALLALSGAGLATAIDGRRGVLWWLLVLSGLCLAATGVVPGEMRNGSPMLASPLTQGHLLMANLAPLLWAIASFLVIRRVKKNPSWKPFATLAVVYAVVCVGGFLSSIVTSAVIPSLAQTPGLVQRFCFAFYFGWFLIMSFHLHSAMPRVRLARSVQLALLVSTMLGLWWTTVGISGAGQGGGASDTARVLVGAIDIHVHNLPDDRPRSIDAIDVAKLASTRGMRAIVLKNHYESTAGIVYLVRKVVPVIEVFGGIDLNLTVGGINPTAVEHMTRVTGGWGRIVWMPTFDAENQVRYSKENRPFVSVSRDGELLPAVKQVISLVAKHGLVLATGHSSPIEGLMLLREGRRQGVQHMVVTHAMNAPVLMDVPQMQEAAKLGAFIEFVGGSLAAANTEARIDRFADAIRKIGPEFCILSSDLGQAGNALPPDGFGAFLVALRGKGFTEQEMDRMSKQNPARLLGLP